MFRTLLCVSHDALWLWVLSQSTPASSLFHVSLSLPFLSGHGVASESVRRPAGPLQPGHVLPRPAEAIHQCQERPDTTPPKIRPPPFPNTEEIVEAGEHAERDDEVIYSRLVSLPLCLHWIAVPQRICFMLLMPPGGF